MGIVGINVVTEKVKLSKAIMKDSLKAEFSLKNFMLAFKIIMRGIRA